MTTYKGQGTPPVTSHGTHSTTASLTRFALPSDSRSPASTPRRSSTRTAGEPATSPQATGKKAKPVAVPTRIGDPSTIKHVFLLVKENRTYDQLFGDMPQGNGDPTLTQFGKQVDAQPARARPQFGLYDNTYDVGTNSAEGHNWLMQGDNPEYTESSAGEYTAPTTPRRTCSATSARASSGPRSQSAGGECAQLRRVRVRARASRPGPGSSTTARARAYETGGSPAQLTTPDLKGNYGSVIPSLNAIADPLSPPFDLTIPDIYRVPDLEAGLREERARPR